MSFVKVVEGSEIYNFPIHHFVHFYSKFWSFACSNSGSAKRVQVRVRPRRPPRRPHQRRAPRPPRRPSRAFPRHPRPEAPYFLPASRVTRRRTVRTHRADRRSVRGPSRRPRPPPYYGGIFTVIRSSQASTRPI
jgi:hypothetical protein